MSNKKTCSRCGGYGPFCASADRKDGLDSVCKKCRKEYNDRPENKKRAKQWRIDHREYTKKRNIEARFGLTPEAYSALVEKQQGRCAICPLKLRLEAGRKQADTAHVDHCHATDVVRGVLCTRCNIMLGMSRDNIRILLSGAKYLFKTQGISEITEKDLSTLIDSAEIVLAAECREQLNKNIQPARKYSRNPRQRKAT